MIGRAVAGECLLADQLFQVTGSACIDVAAQISPDQIALVGQAVRVFLANGIEQQARRFDCGAANDDDARVNLFLLARRAINNRNAGNEAVFVH
ncbi:MAG: hypothetical protein JMDDDDMK_04419 [Acidobacteria bacterium]|nr:hypothetical protein [Acidobacteriota bacterium]